MYSSFTEAKRSKELFTPKWCSKNITTMWSKVIGIKNNDLLRFKPATSGWFELLSCSEPRTYKLYLLKNIRTVPYIAYRINIRVVETISPPYRIFRSVRMTPLLVPYRILQCRCAENTIQIKISPRTKKLGCKLKPK